MRTLMLLSLFFAGLPQLCWANPTPRCSADAAWQTALSATFASSGLPGYCAIQIDAEHTRCFADGYAQKPSRAYTWSTRQPVGSVSKTFIGLALAQLQHDKTLDLDAPIERYLSWRVRNPYFPNVPITLRQLATHTSSIRDRTAAYATSYVPRDSESASLGEFLQRYLDANARPTKGNKSEPRYQRLNFMRAAPGNTYEYSNIGAALAAYVIEVKLEMPFARYVEKNILSPVGMQSSFHAGASDAQLHQSGGSTIKPYRLITYPDGGLIASCNDLARYLDQILAANAGRDSVLDSEAVRQMLAPQFLGKRPAKLPPKITDHGLFWEIRGDKVGHSGSDPGVTALVALDPKKARASVQLTNVNIEQDAALAAQFIALWRMLEQH